MPRRTTQTRSPLDAKAAENAADFLLASIRDPFNVRHCGTCLVGALEVATRIEQQSFESQYTSFNKRVTTAQFNHIAHDKKRSAPIKAEPKLYNGILAFLLIKRTDKQMKRMLGCLSECHCKLDEQSGIVKWYHGVGEETSTSLIKRGFLDKDDALESIEGGCQDVTRQTHIKAKCVFLIHFIWVLHLPLGLSGGLKSVAKGSSTVWPIASKDLIPFGADNFVQSMLQLNRFLPDPLVFRFMGCVLLQCQSLVIPSLIKYKFTDAIIQFSRSTVDRIMSELSLHKPPPPHIIHTFDAFLEDTVLYLEFTMHKIPQECRGPLFGGCETKIVQLCSILLYLYEETKQYPTSNASSTAVFSLTMFAHELYRFFHMHLPPRPDIPVYPSIAMLDSRVFPPPASVRQPKETVILTICTFRTDHRCSAQGCLNSMQSAGKDFQRCGRCGVVAYCGRGCQTKAWKEEEIPHKRLCPIFRNLMALGGGADLFFDAKISKGNVLQSQQIILENWKKAYINEEDLELVEEWAKLVEKSRSYPMPDGTEWNPGYEDYDDLIAILSAGRRPKPRYMNRLARWPSEVAKELKMLRLQPYWEHDFSEI